jgi:hypothetical protein
MTAGSVIRTPQGLNAANHQSALKSLLFSPKTGIKPGPGEQSFLPCFAEARFTRLLRAAPERASPQAVTAELAASPARFSAALPSRAPSKPQASQANILCDKASVCLMTPQQEQVLLEGYQRLATTTREP